MLGEITFSNIDKTDRFSAVNLLVVIGSSISTSKFALPEANSKYTLKICRAPRGNTSPNQVLPSDPNLEIVWSSDLFRGCW